MRSIVAVSNGRAMAGSGLGQRIDAFDDVVRFNNASLAGFEPDVGERTTIWVADDQGRHGSSFDCRRLWWTPNWRRPHVVTPTDWEVIPPDVEDAIRRETAMPSHQWPTTGLMGLVYLLRECDVIHLAGWYRGDAACDAVAFMRHYDPTHHVERLQEPAPVNFAHALGLERLLVDRLIKQGRLIELEGPGHA